MPRRLIDQRGCCSLMEIEILWQAIKLFYRKRHIFRVSATHRLPKQAPLKAHIIFSSQAIFAVSTTEIGIDHHMIANL
jgi:hypothetical protein